MPERIEKVGRYQWRDGSGDYDTDEVVVELPVALSYNGISHAVMMTTPTDLADFALGFSVSEGILSGPQQLLGLDIVEREQGLEIAMEITAGAFAGLKDKRRTLAGRSGCGLCGKESLEALSFTPAPLPSTLTIAHQALQLAQQTLQREQPLKAVTGGVHGAAWCDPDGSIVLVREDVGRHNALDKLLGALCRSDRGQGFVVVTSRASYEMVIKAAACGVELLAAVSAPTALAVEQARAAGMSLVGYLQKGRHAVYTGDHRVEDKK